MFPGRIGRRGASFSSPGAAGDLPFVGNGRTALLLPLAYVVLMTVIASAQYLLNRRATANQHAFLVATLESMLGAVPATGPDTGVR